MPLLDMHRDRSSSHAPRRLLAVAVVGAALVLFASCGGEGAGTITGPETSGTSSPPAGGTTPPTTGTTTPPATPPGTGATPPDTSATTGTGTSTPPAGGAAGAVTAIKVVPSTLTITLGDSSALSASLTTTGTTPAGGWSVTWQSSDPAVVVVSASGMVTAKTVGVAAVTATAGGVTASAVVTVQPQPWVTSVAVSPATANMMVGDKLTMQAVLGTVGATPAGGWPVTWQSSLTQVATVDTSGVVTAVAPGTTTIWAGAGARAGTASVRVVSGPTVVGIALSPATLYLAPGATGSFSPALTTVGTAPTGGWPITWASAAPAIATVDANGLVTGVAPGSTTISATSGSQTAAATVAVSTASGGTASVVNSVTISSPNKAYVLVGGTKTLSATVAASGPPPQNGWVAAWTSSDPSVVTVSGNGATGATLSGVAAGTATVTATVGGVTGTRAVEVLPPPGVIAIRINAQSPYDLAQGDTVTLDVTHTLIGTIPPGGLITTWTTSNPAVATVDATGLVRGVTLGSTTITATSYGKTASIGFNIVTPIAPPPPPTVSGITSMTLTPQNIVLPPGGRGWIQADVVATTSPPQQTGLGWPVAWTSNNPAVVVMPTLLSQYTNFDAGVEGTATITASLGGKTATSTLYVATARSISVTPSAPALNVGQQTTLVPTVTTTGPLPPSGFPVDYQSSSPLVATVSPAGVLTALGAGRTRIQATAGSVSTSVLATVTGPGPTFSIVAADTTKGVVTQSSQGYGVACNFVWSGTVTGTGQIRLGKWEFSLDGTTFYNTSYTGFQVQTIAAGQTATGMGTSGSGPITPTAAPWVMIMRFHYGVNAGLFDMPPSGAALDQWVDRKFVCAP